MPLQMSTLVRMPCFAIGVPLLGIIVPSGPFLNSKVSPLEPLLHLVVSLV
jgi:hypothetical protein